MEQQVDSSKLCSLEVLIKKQIYYDSAKGWGVFLCQRISSKADLVIRGNIPPFPEGESYSIEGVWVNDKKHGRGFNVEKFLPFVPEEKQALLKYLSSDIFPGIGKKTALAIVDHFGAETVAVLDKDIERLWEIKSLSRDRIQKLLCAWKEVSKTRSDLLFLYSYGIIGKTAQKLMDFYGTSVQEELKKNPYSLVRKLKGFSFLRADSIALSLGISESSPERVKSAILHVLWEAGSSGHCFLEQEEVLKSLLDLLKLGEEFLKPLFKASLLSLEQEGALIVEVREKETCLYLRRTYRAEVNLALKVKELLEDQISLEESSDLERRLDIWLERHLATLEMELSSEQKRAVLMALLHPVFILTGGPGVGKSLTSRVILDLFVAKKQKVALAAPTGRAAKRLQELTGAEAKTLHRLLEWTPKDGQFLRNSENPLLYDVLIIDETSMLDIFLSEKLFQAIKKGTKIILIGDSDQLPSIGPGYVLSHLIESQVVPSLRLTKIFRQGLSSDIVKYSHEINQGFKPHFVKTEMSDCHFLSAEPSSVLALMKEFLLETLPARGFEESYIQILSPMKKGLLGCVNLNKEIQKAIFSKKAKPASLKNSNYEFHPGDRVIQLSNAYDLGVFNGDIGYVSNVDLKDKCLVVDFDGRLIVYENEKINHLALAYAITIHKSQGSEFPVVFIPVVPEHSHMLNRNLLYTALTRAKQLAIFFGLERSLGYAVFKDETIKRKTLLKERLVSLE